MTDFLDSMKYDSPQNIATELGAIFTPLYKWENWGKQVN